MFCDIQEADTFTPPAAKEAVGIDFGTTFCVVALCQPAPEVLVSPTYGRLIPSIVQVGGQSVASVKRYLGTQVRPEGYDPFDLAIKLFGHIRQHIHQAVGREISAAVVTVPAYFNEQQRQAVKQAAEASGFEVLRLVAEPTAAAIAYGLTTAAEGLYGVYDLGGGTFDFSVLRMCDGLFQVIATGGDTALGGDDIDQALAQWLYGHPGGSSELIQARQVKERLTEVAEEITPRGQRVSREDLAALMAPFVDRTLAICAQTLHEAHCQDLKGIVMVGGSTRSPFIRQRVADTFQVPLFTSLDPDCAVAMGAALQAYNLTHTATFLLLDVTPLSLGIELMGGVVERLIPRHSPLPASASYVFTTAESGQTKMKIHIVQGERELAADCQSLGMFELTDIPPLPKGKARIHVTFSLSADSLLTVEAWEESAGKRHSMQVNPTKTLSDRQIQEEAAYQAQNSGEDVIKRLWIQKHQQAEEALGESRRLMQSYGFLFSAAEASLVSQAQQQLITAMQTGDVPILTAEFDTFIRTITPLIERYLTHLLKQRFDPTP